ncbi:MAG: hypothetical protein ACRD99_05965 [Nitrososphaera sp.]
MSQANLEITSSLRAALAELYFKEECRQKGWAFASLESIYAGGSARFKDDAVLSFRSGNENIKVRIMHQIIPEVQEICQPVDGENHDFLFSYLVCKIGPQPEHKTPVVANPSALSWVQLKAGTGLFSARQHDALSKIKLSLALFSIRDLLAPPRDIETRWDTRTGGEWLDLLDELKEQEEYDDEYF